MIERVPRTDEGSLIEPPICECGCELSMYWHQDPARTNGGRWRCRKKVREYDRRWRESNPDKKRERNARRLIVGGMYLGMIGFTQREMEGMLNGSSE